MYYDLKKDAMRGNWWVVKHYEGGFHEVIHTLSHKLTHSEAKIQFEVLVQKELQNDKV